MFKIQQHTQQQQHQKIIKQAKNTSNNMSSDNIKYTQVQFIETVLDIANNGWANSIIGEDQKNWVCGRIMSRLPDDWVSNHKKSATKNRIFFKFHFYFLTIF